MHKLTLAERILSPITGAPRANEIVGDLLETAPSTPAFWFSILCIALAYTWRWLIGIPAAFHFFGLLGAVIAVAAGDFPLYVVIQFGATREGVRPLRQDLLLTLGFLSALAVEYGLKRTL